MAAFFQAGPEQLGQWFQMIDTDRSGQLSVQELQRALAQGGLVYSTKFVASLLSMFDANGTGQASYQEFQQIVSRDLSYVPLDQARTDARLWLRSTHS